MDCGSGWLSAAAAPPPPPFACIIADLSMAAHYSPEAVQASLEMVSQAMRAKDAAARRLQEQVAALVSAASGDGGDSAAAGPPSDAQVAETCERLRAQAAGEQPLVAAEREKRRAVIEQLAAVKSELDAARQAQDAAVAELALLDAAVQEMRAEREEVRRRRAEAAPVACQLLCCASGLDMLTKR